MIYIDSTEARENTRLPNASSYTSLSWLERVTGADILVSPWDNLPTDYQDIPPHRLALGKHCWHGCLIQRKSGADFLSSIPDLAEIEFRMLQWSPNPWLLITGVWQSKSGDLLVNDRAYHRTRHGWAQSSGAMDAWCDRGGSVKCLRDDVSITPFLDARQVAVLKWLDIPEKEVIHKSPQQNLARSEQNWYNTGQAWPSGIGPTMLKSLAVAIAEYGLPPTLLNVIALALSDAVLDVHLWGPKSLQAVRSWYGVDEPIAWVRASSVIDATGSFALVGDITVRDGHLHLNPEQKERKP